MGGAWGVRRGRFRAQRKTSAGWHGYGHSYADSAEDFCAAVAVREQFPGPSAKSAGLANQVAFALLGRLMAKKPVVLIIRDGWGVNPGGRAQAEQNGDATLLGRTPFHDQLYAKYPQSRLSASGMDVGLPEGQMGNSEVGHLNLGAGRIVYQDLTRINKVIADGELAANPVLVETFAKAKGRRLHLLGLVSEGGVHSHVNHLVALVQAAHEAGVGDILIHAITDGRDT